MGSTPVATVDATGIHKPTIAACLTYFNEGYQSIYGSDVIIESSTQDGELLGLLASAVDDANAMAVQTYNAYSPATAQGAGLSSNVKINGLAREIPTFSTAPLLLVGTVGTTITNGIAEDANQNQWSLGATPIIIPSAGQITATATCTTLGAIAAPIGTITQIKTQTRGWQTVSNTAAATPGAPVESDPTLRIRQAVSTMAPAQGPLAAVLSAVAAIPGVAPFIGYENTTNALDTNGAPGHTIYVVTTGGDSVAIASAINIAKQGGTGTFGTTTETIVDAYGVPHPVNFFFATQEPIIWGVSIQPLNGFSTNTNALIQASLAAWTNSLGIGTDIQLSRAYAAGYLQPSIQAATAQLQADMAANALPATLAADLAAITSLNAAAQTYEITALTVAISPAALAALDVPILFNQSAQSLSASVTVTVI
jgi:uncharacterized phage protein gp47/JayE